MEQVFGRHMGEVEGFSGSQVRFSKSPGKNFTDRTEQPCTFIPCSVRGMELNETMHVRVLSKLISVPA